MQYNEQEEGESKPQKRNRNVWLVSLLSSIMGALIVILFIPVLSNLDIINYQLNSSEDVVTLGESKLDSSAPNVVPISNSNTINSAIIEAVENVSPAIVGVINLQQGSDVYSSDLKNIEAGTGSGVIYKKENGKAYIVTNSHVIDGAKQVEVVMKNTNRVQAEVIGDDPLTDLAVLRIADKDVTHVANFGDSQQLRAGESVIAIGNPLGLEFSHTVTQGIISATERSMPITTSNGQWELTVIQTDAAINPGNSGGALVNTSGEVIGINSLKISQPLVEGLGFAIPSNEVLPIITELMEKSYIQRPYVGIETVDLRNVPEFFRQQWFDHLDDTNEGIVVSNVIEGSPAHDAQLREGDYIIEINNETIVDSQFFRKFLYTDLNIGDLVKLKVFRDGKELFVEILLTENK